MRTIFIILLLFIITSAYSEEKRFFQFGINDNNSSYIALEAGSSVGINIVSKAMQLSFLYSLYNLEGYSITTDLMLLNRDITDTLSLKLGLGGGIIFKPEMNDFTSNALLRFPVITELNSLYLSFIPAVGYTMFEYDPSLVYNLSLTVGYKFKFRKADKTTLPPSSEPIPDGMME